MLLSILAILIGAAIGRARGGRLSAFTTTKIHSPGWLATGISVVLIISLMDPSLPLLWTLVAHGAFAYFGLRNLHFTGMIVLLIGLLMNLTPLIANGAVPVSERALVSVGSVNEAGEPIIDGVRESSTTAGSFGFFGDVVPVPVLGSVVSLGDLVVAVALADIVMHLMLREKPRRRDDEAFTYAAITDDEVVIDLRDTPALPAAPTPTVKRNRPAHAANRRPRFRTLQSMHVPAHAAAANPLLSDTDKSIKTKPSSFRPNHSQVAAPKGDDAVIVLTNEADPQGYETSADDIATTKVDSRPIIDLTSSPTDEQLLEFLRRRCEADASHAQRNDASRTAHGTSKRSASRGRGRSNHMSDA